MLLVLLLPLLALAAAFASLSEWPEFWHALLLYCCLDWQNQRNQAFLLAQSIEKQQLSLARDLIKPLVLRQSQQLSEVGLCKATIESLTLRLAKQWVGVLFWFLVGGGLAALQAMAVSTGSRTGPPSNASGQPWRSASTACAARREGEGALRCRTP